MHTVVLFTIPDVVQLTMPITLKRTASIPSFCNSSDTEPLETPPRKRTRLNHDHSPGSTSSSMTLRTSSSASRTYIELFRFLSLIHFLAISRSRRKPSRESDFELRDILRRCAATPVSHAAIRDLKSFPKGDFFMQYTMANHSLIDCHHSSGESAALYAVQRLVQAVKTDVKSRVDSREEKLLETELYLEWLKEFKFVITGIEVNLCFPSNEPLCLSTRTLLELACCQDARDAETRHRARAHLVHDPLPPHRRIYIRSGVSSRRLVIPLLQPRAVNISCHYDDYRRIS